MSNDLGFLIITYVFIKSFKTSSTSTEEKSSLEIWNYWHKKRKHFSGFLL
jgi:hypothetical protein